MRFWYSEPFCAPSAVGSVGGNGNDSYTKILLHCDGADGSTSFPDVNAGGSSHTWTSHGATVSTVQSRFGGASAYFDGASWIDTPDHADFTLGARDWTVDCLFKPTSGDGTDRFIFAQSASGLADIAITGILTSFNTIQVTVKDEFAGGYSVTSITTFLASDPNLHHLEICRIGNFLRLFLDGAQEAGDVGIVLPVKDSASKFTIGREGETDVLHFIGYIEEFRLSVGIARHTSNFTPPTLAYF